MCVSLEHALFKERINLINTQICIYIYIQTTQLPSYFIFHVLGNAFLMVLRDTAFFVGLFFFEFLTVPRDAQPEIQLSKAFINNFKVIEVLCNIIMSWWQGYMSLLVLLHILRPGVLTTMKGMEFFDFLYEVGDYSGDYSGHVLRVIEARRLAIWDVEDFWNSNLRNLKKMMTRKKRRILEEYWETSVNLSSYMSGNAKHPGSVLKRRSIIARNIGTIRVISIAYNIRHKDSTYGHLIPYHCP